MPWRRAASIASSATSAALSESAAKMPPQWNQRAPSRPKTRSQSMSPGLSSEAAERPRSEQPSAARTPKPRSTKFSPLRAPAPDSVVGDPAHVGLVDAALEDEILEQPADRVVGERGDDRRTKTEAATEAPGDVVLAAALRDRERARRRDSAVAGIETQHHLAERHQVEPALLARAGDSRRHQCRSVSRTPLDLVEPSLPQ